MTRRMSNRYRARAFAFAAIIGGWSGPATMRALEPKLLGLHDLGLTSKAAGIVLAREYKLHTQRDMYAELAGF